VFRSRGWSNFARICPIQYPVKLLGKASGRRRVGNWHGVYGHDGGLLLRVGVGPIAAALAAFAAGFVSYSWLAPDSDSANAGLRVEAFDAAFSSVARSGLVDVTASVNTEVRDRFRVRLASVDTGDASGFAFMTTDDLTDPTSFGERFSFDLPSAPHRFSQSTASFDDRFNTTSSFEDRFGGNDVFAPSTTVRAAAAAAPRTVGARVAAAAATLRAATRSVVAQATPKRQPQGQYQLASASDTSLPLSYAPNDSVKRSSALGSKDSDPLADIDTSHTAIYDISSRTVYMPNGRRLEAHSGLGDRMDDVRYVHERMTGPTPPNVYDLKMRESLFHGVRAIRLVPTDESKMHGRAGILAHSYMLGPSGQSNGCVSFSDYPAFLEAFQRGEVNRIVVVERLANVPAPRTAADWLKDLFRGS